MSLEAPSSGETITVFLAGDVMTGRGIDQILPHPSDPILHEPYVKSAADYVRIAEESHGPISRPADPSYVWGDVLAELSARAADLRVVNLETSVTRSSAAEPKGINYRMSPDNIGVLTAAGIDCCALANNHVLDWGAAGLLETLDTLRAADIAQAGAGRDVEEATRPAVLTPPGGPRMLVFALAFPTSGVPMSWSATASAPGVWVLPAPSWDTADEVAETIARHREAGDIVLVSVHWGGNWDYQVPREQVDFAHRLVDGGGVDIVHGHSSHHPKALEVYRDRLVMYGCGDLLNDYEGIGGHGGYRPDLVLGYFAVIDAGSGRLVRLDMAPFSPRRFRLQHATPAEAEWLARTLDRESGRFGASIEVGPDGALALR